jgi:sugar lactone lactonase YvrE
MNVFFAATGLGFSLGALTLHAQVELIAGAPKTEPVSEPFSVDFDSKGILYGVEFTKANRIFRVVGGKLGFVAGVNHNAENEKPAPGTEVNDGPDPLAALFNGMHDIQITKSDQAIIGDSFNHRVRLLDLKSGVVSTLAGTGKTEFVGDGGPATQAGFNITMTASLSPDEARLYIADIGHHRTREVNLATGIVTTVAGNGKGGLPTDGGSALDTPMGDTRAVTQAKDGTLYILLRGGNSLVALKDGKLKTVVNATGKKGYSGDGGPGRDATMNGPKYVAMDDAENVLIADAENHCIRRYVVKTGVIELIAGAPPKAGSRIGGTFLQTEFRRPHGVRIGPDGKLYIADTYNNRVLRGDYPATR